MGADYRIDRVGRIRKHLEAVVYILVYLFLDITGNSFINDSSHAFGELCRVF